MTKSKKQNQKKTSIAPKSKSRKVRRVRKNKSNMKSANKINIGNTGLTELIYKEGNKSPKKTVFKWDGNYDGKNANIHMNLNVDGKQTKSDIKLSNEEIMELLSQNTVDKSLDRRLDDDFNNILNQPPVYMGDMPIDTAMHIDTPMPRQMSRPIIISDMQMSKEPLFIENDMISRQGLRQNLIKTNTKKHKKTHK